MEAQFSQRSLAFERISACDGATLTEDEIQAIKQNCLSGLDCTPNELACTISHRTCWRLVADGDDDHVCIFEDGVHLSSDAGNLLSKASWIPKDADLIKLETFNVEAEFYHKRPIKAQDRTLYPVRGMHQGAAGYIISRTAARRLLDKTRNDYGGVSYLLFGPTAAKRADLHTYQLYPALCIQNMRLSGDKIPRLANLLGHERLAHIEQGTQALAAQAKTLSRGVWSQMSRNMKEQARRLFVEPYHSEIVPFQQ
ncbi:MAG: hypothetical protein MnENMB40S_09250 [Rhizobiaceae bacterium MnEN-MB40S]|nr:MAG: hypothetical protein MnENMB40S_09250 [Rhizobiaceae bacterium MnEN-MB40S]